VNEICCSADPNLGADAFCTACRQPYSGKFLGVRADGRAVCFTCARYEEVELLEAPQNSDPTDPVLGDGWFHAIRKIITQPHRTFELPYGGRLGPALLFGYLFTFFGFISTTIWNLLLQREGYLEWHVDSWARAQVVLTNEQVTQMLWIVMPFYAVLRLFLGAGLLHVGIRLIVGEQAEWRASLRLFALTSGTLVLCAIPTLGPFLALVTWISASMAYMHTHHNVRTVKGLMALLPCLLIITAIGPNTFMPG
jgi:hypothetical protein